MALHNSQGRKNLDFATNRGRNCAIRNDTKCQHGKFRKMSVDITKKITFQKEDRVLIFVDRSAFKEHTIKDYDSI